MINLEKSSDFHDGSYTPDKDNPRKFRAERIDFFNGGTINVYIPEDDAVLRPPLKTADHWLLDNGNKDSRFDLALISHEDHKLLDNVANSMIDDVTWSKLNLSEFVMELAASGTPQEKLYTNLSIDGLTNQARYYQLLVDSNLQLNAPTTIGKSYVESLDTMSDLLLNALKTYFPDYKNSTIKVPFRGAGLTARPFVRDGRPIAPVKFTRIALENEKYAVGITSPRSNFKSGVLNDLENSKDNRAIVLEACISTGLTNISDMAHRVARGVKPSELLIITPVASRQGVLSILTASQLLDIPVKLLVGKIYPRVGNAWGSGEDSVKDSQGNSVIGDPPRIAGPEVLLERLSEAELAFAKRHTIVYP